VFGRRVEMSLDDAMALMIRRRPTAQPIPEFMVLLRTLDVVLPRSSRGHADGQDTVVVTQRPPAASSVTGCKNKKNHEQDDNEVEEEEDAVVHDEKRIRTVIGPQRPPPTGS
jgi:hypothetical protein